MSTVLPSKKADQLKWFEDRTALWELNASTIGITTALAEELTGLQEGATAASTNLDAARQNLKNAVLDYNDSMSAMVSKGRGLIKMIKARAESSPGVYQLANIPPPSEPTPAPPPAMPTDVSGEVANCGSIRLTWKGTVAGGVFYNIYRRVDNEGVFDLIKSVGSKRFLDRTVPAGAQQVAYVLVPQRGDVTGSQTEQIVVPLSCAAAQTPQLKMLKAA